MGILKNNGKSPKDWSGVQVNRFNDFIRDYERSNRLSLNDININLIENESMKQTAVIRQLLIDYKNRTPRERLTELIDIHPDDHIDCKIEKDVDNLLLEIADEFC